MRFQMRSQSKTVKDIFCKYVCETSGAAAHLSGSGVEGVEVSPVFCLQALRCETVNAPGHYCNVISFSLEGESKMKPEAVHQLWAHLCKLLL